MTRKKKTRYKKSTKKYSVLRKNQQLPQDLLQQQIVGYLSQNKEPLSISALLAMLDAPRSKRRTLQDHLDLLVRKGTIIQHKKKYSLASDSHLQQGTLSLTSKGFGFVTLDAAGPGDKDIYIPQNAIAGASHGDTVLIRLSGKSTRRQEGAIIHIIKRAVSRLCGIYTAAGKTTGYITPDNDKIPFTVLIRRGNSLGARNGMAVLAEILDYGQDKKGPEGKILEVLGDPLEPGVQIRMAMEQFSLRQNFPEGVIKEAELLVEPDGTDAKRLDLRNIEHVTIDGATARDFDDAVCVIKSKSGFRLYVSIADVSYYVRPNSTLDQEAYRRGTSVYLPDRVLPMLPERLSNNLCSLVPHEDRPAFSAILDFDLQGNRTGARFHKSFIHSKQRFTYSTVNSILYKREENIRQKHAPLLPMLEAAAELTEILFQRRMKRGSLGFTIPEPNIIMEGKEISNVARSERNKAHQLIEECMLAANEAVAETLANQKQPTLYRVHEKPDSEKVEKFIETAQTLGLDLQPLRLSPAWFASVLKAAHKSPAEYVVNNLLLRTMQQARYAEDNLGHFGLAAEYYLHFTSPIRRYPDLVAHRALQMSLTGKKNKKKLLPGNKDLSEAGISLSKKERTAVDIERNVQARLAVLFMLGKEGQEFNAIISGVTSFALFVELLDHFISGAIPVGDIGDDYYIYDARRHQMTGELGGKKYRIGMLVRVRLERTDILSKRLTFSIIEE